MDEASREVESSASWARLAREIAVRVRGPEGWRHRVLGYAAGHEANSLRVAGELKAAETTLDEAKRLWGAGRLRSGRRGSTPGRLLDLEGTGYAEISAGSRSLFPPGSSQIGEPLPGKSLDQEGLHAGGDGRVPTRHRHLARGRSPGCRLQRTSAEEHPSYQPGDQPVPRLPVRGSRRPGPGGAAPHRRARRRDHADPTDLAPRPHRCRTGASSRGATGSWPRPAGSLPAAG